MKLKPPDGVGDPCVAGTVIAAHDGLYDVTDETGALLIECFGFVEVTTPKRPAAAPARQITAPARPTRRKRSAANKT